MKHINTLTKSAPAVAAEENSDIISTLIGILTLVQSLLTAVQAFMTGKNAS